jgi:hypothetical protein
MARGFLAVFGRVPPSPIKPAPINT